MVNALFVLIVFLLQLNKDNIHVKWPFGVRTNITYDESTQEVNFIKGISEKNVSKIVLVVRLNYGDYLRRGRIAILGLS